MVWEVHSSAMRISRRTSGGRGEYEISENDGGLAPRDLIGRQLTLVLDGQWSFKTGTRLLIQGGKPRLRRINNSLIQVQRQLAAALLMPHPVRQDVALRSGKPILKANGYAVEHIDLKSVKLSGGSAASARVSGVVLRNYNLHAELLGLPQRLKQIRMIWRNIQGLPPVLGALLLEHKGLVEAGGPIPKKAEGLVAQLQSVLTSMAVDLDILHRQEGEDVVPDLLRALHWADVPPAPDLSVDEVAPDEDKLKKRIADQWKRWVNARGPASAKFRQDVRQAYHWTCMVCGAYLPATPFNAAAGVDAAHILPWATYDLDMVSNGLCLCKHHHWAFDEGLLTIRWDGRQYLVEVPDVVRDGMKTGYPSFPIAELLSRVGPIPSERLPFSGKDRPNPQFLDLLRQSQ